PNANVWAGIGTNNCTPPSGCTQSVPSCGRIFTAQPGSWSTNAGWAGTYPGQQAGDCVVIPNNTTVTYDVTTAQPNPIARILVNGWPAAVRRFHKDFGLRRNVQPPRSVYSRANLHVIPVLS